MDQIRTIGTSMCTAIRSIIDRDQMAKVEHAVARYLVCDAVDLQMGYRPGLGVEPPGIEPGSYGIPRFSV